MNDLKFACRQLLKSPGFTAVAVLTLALGIGANTAMFSVINVVMLRPLPFPNSEGLFWIEQASEQDRHEPWGGHYLTWKEHCQTLQDLAAYDGTSMTLTGPGEAERIPVGRVSANFFPLLGVQPLTPGPTFSPDDDRPGGDRVALLSQRYWRQRFGADSDVVGRTIVLDDVGYTVVGVLPESFRFFQQFDVWTPLALDPQQELTGSIFSYQPVVALPWPKMKPAQVQAELDTLTRRYEALRPGGKPRFADRQARLVPLRDHFLGDSRRPLLILLGAVAFVLLIACANVANLLLARTVARQKELAVRAALGASRLHLTRQTLTECLLLALIGGAAGLLLAYWLVRLFGLLNLGGVIGPMATVSPLEIDVRVFAFATILSIATGIAFGLSPTFRFSRPNLDLSLRDSTRGGTAHGNGLRGALLAGEVALAVVLLAGAGLFMRSFVRLIDVDPGYRAEGLLTAQMRLPPRYDGESKRTQFYDQLLARVAALPGVESVGATSQLPLTRYNMGGTLRVKDMTEESGKRETAAPITAVNADYFRTVGTRLREGRLFDHGDGPGATSVVATSLTFGDVRWDRHRSTSHLSDETEALIARKAASCVIDAGGQHHGLLPDDEILVVPRLFVASSCHVNFLCSPERLRSEAPPSSVKGSDRWRVRSWPSSGHTFLLSERLARHSSLITHHYE